MSLDDPAASSHGAGEPGKRLDSARIDAAALRQLLADVGPEMMAVIVERCRADLVAQVAAATRAAAAGSLADLGRAAHALAAAAGSVGLNGLLAPAAILAEACAGGEAERARALVAAIEAELPGALAALGATTEALAPSGV